MLDTTIPRAELGGITKEQYANRKRLRLPLPKQNDYIYPLWVVQILHSLPQEEQNKPIDLIYHENYTGK
jgi:hypothetical protein